jgi:hypothetical protein
VEGRGRNSRVIPGHWKLRPHPSTTPRR